MTSPAHRRGRGAGWDPFAEIDRLSRQIEEVYGGWPSFSEISEEHGFLPLADIEESDEAFLVELELPGVERQDVDVEVGAGALRVSGERKERQRSGVMRRRTRVTGRFHFEASFPGDIDDDAVTADLQHGVLTVRLPKASAAPRRRIEIR
jgi:HSP20 family protein